MVSPCRSTDRPSGGERHVRVQPRLHRQDHRLRSGQHQCCFDNQDRTGFQNLDDVIDIGSTSTAAQGNHTVYGGIGNDTLIGLGGAAGMAIDVAPTGGAAELGRGDVVL